MKPVSFAKESELGSKTLTILRVSDLLPFYSLAIFRSMNCIGDRLITDLLNELFHKKVIEMGSDPDKIT